MNLDLDFLTTKQVIGDSYFESWYNNKLKILEEYGLKCHITDFSILLGGHVSSYINKNKTNVDNIGWWWTKTSAGDDSVFIIDDYGDKYKSCLITLPIVGARPTLSYSLIKKISK